MDQDAALLCRRLTNLLAARTLEPISYTTSSTARSGASGKKRRFLLKVMSHTHPRQAQLQAHLTTPAGASA